jgi:hypothetical protein
MNTENYYVIKPTTFNRKKVVLGHQLLLTESQARPLRNGGFVTQDKAAAERIVELIKENEALKTNPPNEAIEEGIGKSKGENNE